MKNQRGGKNVRTGGTNIQAEFALGYLYAHIKTQLNSFGATYGTAIPVAVAANRVGALLLSETGRGVLDGAEYLPEMRGHAANGDEVGTATAKVHVRSRHDKALTDGLCVDDSCPTSGPHRHLLRGGVERVGRVLSKKARKAIGRAQKLRWKKYHDAIAGNFRKSLKKAA